MRSFGFEQGTQDWRRVMDDPDVDIVMIAAPNMLHVELIEAACAAGKHVFCEKPVGGTPEQTVRAERAARQAGVITGVGYNYRWAPLVRYVAQLIDQGELGEITNYRGRFFSMYGADPLGLLSWRFKAEEGGHGASTDLLSHAVDLGQMLLGPITRLVGTTETFIRERPLPGADGASHFGRGAPGDPTGPVTNEDYASMLCEFASGARGTFEASRAIVGPENQMAFDVYGTAARPAGTSSSSTSCSCIARRPIPARATPRCSAGIASPTTAASSPATRTRSATRTWSSSRTTSSAARWPRTGRSRRGSRTRSRP